MALAFTAFHYLLTVAFGRFGLVVSVFLLALQITATEGLYPIQLLAPAFQVVSPILPLTYAVEGIQAIVAGSGVGAIVAPTLYLVAFGLLSMLFAVLSLRRVRRVRALAIAPVRA
jgi:putative membrane protein